MEQTTGAKSPSKFRAVLSVLVSIAMVCAMVPLSSVLVKNAAWADVNVKVASSEDLTKAIEAADGSTTIELASDVTVNLESFLEIASGKDITLLGNGAGDGKYTLTLNGGYIFVYGALTLKDINISGSGSSYLVRVISGGSLTVDSADLDGTVSESVILAGYNSSTTIYSATIGDGGSRALDGSIAANGTTVNFYPTGATDVKGAISGSFAVFEQDGYTINDFKVDGSSTSLNDGSYSSRNANSLSITLDSLDTDDESKNSEVNEDVEIIEITSGDDLYTFGQNYSLADRTTKPIVLNLTQDVNTDGYIEISGSAWSGHKITLTSYTGKILTIDGADTGMGSGISIGSGIDFTFKDIRTVCSNLCSSEDDASVIANSNCTLTLDGVEFIWSPASANEDEGEYIPTYVVSSKNTSGYAPTINVKSAKIPSASKGSIHVCPAWTADMSQFGIPDISVAACTLNFDPAGEISVAGAIDGTFTLTQSSTEDYTYKVSDQAVVFNNGKYTAGSATSLSVGSSSNGSEDNNQNPTPDTESAIKVASSAVLKITNATGVESCETSTLDVEYTGEGTLTATAKDSDVVAADIKDGKLNLEAKSVGHTQVTIADETDSSTVDVYIVGIDFLGGSLRMDYTDATGTIIYDKTSMRFGYKVELPQGLTQDDLSISWDYGMDPKNLLFARNATKTVYDAQANTVTANIVFTGITSIAYAENIFARLNVKLNLGSDEEAELQDLVRTRSVFDIARSIRDASTVGDDQKSFANKILKFDTSDDYEGKHTDYF